jgi:two-component system nitrate/nitrite response regulator NarL
MRILLADDHALVRDAIAHVLRQHLLAQVETARDLASALDRVEGAGGFDVILLDLRMQGMDDLAGLSAMRARAPGVPVALLSGHLTRGVVDAALQLGAAGCLSKAMSVQSLVAALRLMVSGAVFVPLTEANSFSAGPTLTPGEDLMVGGLGKGLSNKDLARELGLRDVTIKRHLKTLFRKIGARNRTEAALWAANRGLT